VPTYLLEFCVTHSRPRADCRRELAEGRRRGSNVRAGGVTAAEESAQAISGPSPSGVRYLESPWSPADGCPV
jgi:hypothetical protein